MIDFLHETIYQGDPRENARVYLNKLIDSGKLLIDDLGRFHVYQARNWVVRRKYRMWTAAKFAMLGAFGLGMDASFALHDSLAALLSFAAMGVCALSLAFDDYSAT